MRAIISFIFMVVVVLSPATDCFSANKIKVAFDVSHDGVPISLTALKSLFKRELRTFQDVEITSKENAEYLLEVKSIGVSCISAQEAQQVIFFADFVNLVRKDGFTYYHLRGNFYNSCKKNDIESCISIIVANFDEMLLEPER